MDKPPPDPPDPPDPMDFTSPVHTTSLKVAPKRPVEKESEVTVPPKKTTVEPSASIQHTFTHPSFLDGSKLAYDTSDQGPFLVQVIRSEPCPSAGTTIRPIKFGQLLHKNNVPGLTKDSIKNVGRNRIMIEFKSAENANNFILNPLMSINKFSASIPLYHITRMGIVRHIPIDWSMEELVTGLEYPSNCGVAIKARRLNRKVFAENMPIWVPTETVVITFQGQTLPKNVYCFNTSLPVEIYQLPSIQCNACCRFGHIKTQCRSRPRCYRCAQNHTGESCSVPENEATCLFCSGSHFANNKVCPEHSRQKSIKMVMSEDNVSYTEASQRFPPVRRSYADVASLLSSAPEGPILRTPQKQPNTTTSYRKTVVANRRPRPELGKSYDKEAHFNLINSPTSSMPNGCALTGIANQCVPQPNDNLIELLTSILVNILTKFNDALPNNVIQMLHQMITLITPNVRSHSPSMEL